MKALSGMTTFAAVAFGFAVPTSAALYGDAPDARHAYAVHDPNRPRPAKVAVRDGVPSDAIVLFDGTAESVAKNWCDENGGPTKWTVKNGELVCRPGSGWIRTKRDFADCQLHVEWKAPSPGQGESQGRGNSGVIFQKRYEIQVLESHTNVTYADGQAGAVYGQHPPMVNPANPEGEWQSYDVVFHPPEWREDGTLVDGGSFTVFFNGVLVQDHWQLEGPCHWCRRTAPEKHPRAQPFYLQDHGNPVPYRNVWIRPIPSRRAEKTCGPGTDAKAVAELQKKLAAELKAKYAAKPAGTLTGRLFDAWEVVGYDPSEENLDAAAKIAGEWIAGIRALDDAALVKREKELLSVVKEGRKLGERGAKRCWEERLLAPGFAKGMLAKLELVKAKKFENLSPVEIGPDQPLAKAAPWNAGKPVVNGPDRFGATPGREFRYAFPVRGAREGLRFEAAGALPEGAALDAKTGVLAGRVKKPGTYGFSIRVRNAEGGAEKPFSLVIGDDARGQTPLMGWTSWNAAGNFVTQRHVLKAAKLLVEKGFAARGYAFVNTDSCWQGLRCSKRTAALQANPRRFPDMKAMVDEIHGLGLKAGIYSTPMVIAWGSEVCNAGLLPGSTTYPRDLDDKLNDNAWGGVGRTRHEKDDAKQWAEWGFDYLKYDWPACDVPHAKAMREALDATGRDFELCLTTSCRIEWYDDYHRLAQLTRASGDTFDNWPTIRACMWNLEPWAAKCGRGTWYDLDMLALGPVVHGRDEEPAAPLSDVFRNKLTREEQITHFALWAFLPSPLQLSWDLEFTDDFTYDLVCNEELIALNQDSHGTSAKLLMAEGGVWVWTRDLADGSKAFAFFNPTAEPVSLVYPLGRTGRLRDLIGGRDLGVGNAVRLTLPVHATRVVRIVK